MSFIDDINELRENLIDSMGIPKEYFEEQSKRADKIRAELYTVQEVKDPEFNWYTENKNGLDPDMEVSIIYQ